MNALNVLCAQLTRDLFAIAKFLFVCLLNSELIYAFVFSHVFDHTCIIFLSANSIRIRIVATEQKFFIRRSLLLLLRLV